VISRSRHVRVCVGLERGQDRAPGEDFILPAAKCACNLKKSLDAQGHRISGLTAGRLCLGRRGVRCSRVETTRVRAYLGRSNFALGMIASLPLIRFGATIGIALMTTRSRWAARCDEGDQGFDVGKAWLLPILALSLNKSGTLRPDIGLIAV
jgi:hypothetical protein